MMFNSLRLHSLAFKRKAKIASLLSSFAPQIESAYQEHFYAKNRTPLRVAIILLTGLCLFVGLLHLVTGQSIFVGLAFGGAALSNALLLRLVLRQSYNELWQPLVVASSLFSLDVTMAALSLQTDGDDRVNFLNVLLGVSIMASRALRLQRRWLMTLHLGMVAMGAWSIVFAGAWTDLYGFLTSSVIAMALPQVLTRRYDKLERADFLGRYTLLQERDAERHKREQTENMLHVLSQAIGGIVHDLGNPLTAVQSGAETLRDFVESGQADKELVREFAEIIADGAQMLNHLRLSLMEQTRVLEGKPIPVELKNVSIRSVVEAGARYQKPRFKGGRAVVLSGDEIEICVDDMKMITVLMNLIGNALKYSDGEVEINWRLDGDCFLIAVLDQGRQGRGISQAQAEQLFVPFGRLDTHAEIEGTGLGLLSVKKIVEAHNGEIYIEGFTDGQVQSAPFRTSPYARPASLSPKFCSAFVIACPLQTSATAPPVQQVPAETSAPQTPMLLEDAARNERTPDSTAIKVL